MPYYLEDHPDDRDDQGRFPAGAPALDRFHQKWDANPDTGCWDWNAAKDAKGYGLFWFRKQMMGAHRASYILHTGPIPQDYHVGHKCAGGPVPGCVNPAHLEALPVEKNSGRGYAEKTRALAETCRSGHEYTKENTGTRSDGSRECLTCKAERRARFIANRRAARAETVEVAA